MTKEDENIVLKQKINNSLYDEIQNFFENRRIKSKTLLIDFAYNYGVIQGIRQERAKRKNKSIKKD